MTISEDSATVVCNHVFLHQRWATKLHLRRILSSRNQSSDLLLRSIDWNLRTIARMNLSRRPHRTKLNRCASKCCIRFTKLMAPKTFHQSEQIQLSEQLRLLWQIQTSPPRENNDQYLKIALKIPWSRRLQPLKSFSSHSILTAVIVVSQTRMSEEVPCLISLSLSLPHSNQLVYLRSGWFK